MTDRQTDILIVGGGLIGASLQLALTQLGYETLLIEKKPFAQDINYYFDARSLALAPTSVQILEMLNVWPLLLPHATPINTIHISERRRFGRALLRSQASPLGYVVEMQYINQALYQLLNQDSVLAPATLTHVDSESGCAIITKPEGDEVHIQAKLIVAADGAESIVRQCCGLDVKVEDYGQHALVANIGLARSHHNIAYERFSDSGPLAMLPLTEQRVAMVWALSPQEAARLQQCEEYDFLKTLQRVFGYRLGKFIKVGHRHIFPLRQILMPKQGQGHVIFVGNAAHTLHPVAGQGFNLGLRDMAMLAQCIAEEGLANKLLFSYEQTRAQDQRAITQFTHQLIRLFAIKAPGFAMARGLGLFIFDNTPLFKSLISRCARGFVGKSPDLVCGIPLSVSAS